MEHESSGWRGKFAGLALTLALFSVVWFALAALGSKFGWWDWQFGLGKMTGNVNAGWGRIVIALALGSSVLALLFALIKAPRKRPFMVALAALLIAGFSTGRWMAFQLTALRLPPIADIQTNWDAPIMPSEALLAARKADGAANEIVEAPIVAAYADANWPGTGGQLVSELQEEAEFNPDTQKKAKNAPYPNIETLELMVGPEEAFDAALTVMTSAGMEIVTQDRVGRSLEGTVTTGWFGFKDDVMVRITPSADMTASLVDMRSTSRVGLSDLGANSKRVRNLLDEIERVAN